MVTPVDIHTHHLPQVPGKAIVNSYPEAFTPQEGGWYSVGIHPWRISSAKQQLPAELVAHPQVLAIGEAGLDRLADTPIDIQTEVFEFQARIAAEADKPLVIHLVKAVDQLLKLKQALRPSNPWIIHGFRGKPALAEEFLRHGFYLSFGERYQADALRITPPDRLFLETDESPVPIAELYRRAAGVRGILPEQLGETVRENIGKVFFRQ